MQRKQAYISPTGQKKVLHEIFIRVKIKLNFGQKKQQQKTTIVDEAGKGL